MTEHTEKWLYRPIARDDWGTVRTSDGDFVGQIRFPYHTPEQLDECRRTKTDPWEKAGRLAASAPTLYEALNEILTYSGGADSALDDPYVVERARAALALARGEP